jgi:hypothetical protein
MSRFFDNYACYISVSTCYAFRFLVEGFFSKLARSVLLHIRVTSKQELKDRIGLQWTTSTRTPPFTHGPTNSIKPPDMIRTLETMNL